ncbi:hypothetical protein PIB30_007384 [Stylosanthes scabra]|uniref:Uncharacterized protein n=1 Tax=Stylosanthes scabra TaxID=79078 RepID=A0ABU6Z2B0_9FABA|nr:hypothetical protein [Stylosanthes scabra]
MSKSFYNVGKPDSFTCCKCQGFVCYFLLFHETKELPRKKQYPEIEWCVFEQVPQFESLKPLSDKSLLQLNKKPFDGACFKYFRAWRAALKCASIAQSKNWLSLLTAKLMSDLVLVR